VWTSQDHHTVELAPAVETALQKAGLTASDLGALGVALGPGSFTGLRIGLALAKGMVLVHRLPLIGIPTLDILAAAQPILDAKMAAVLRAGRGRLAVGWYQATNRTWQSTDEFAVFTPDELAQHIQAPTLVCGELSEEVRQLLKSKGRNVILASPAQSVRRPAVLAELAWKRWQAGQVDITASLAPIYLHYKDPIPG
jgi:tRNA threonylcarbamoyladenosine biosynthesis protein TsaB